jgi:type IV secretory pathway TraG/TraD family ATPase VirD4
MVVSRQETARPLLMPGEIMQLPLPDEIVMVAGTPPIRATKARYHEDKRNPTLDVVEAIARVLEAEASDLLCG